eukprot:scaffold7072_cov267-Pinguiococcus_pyrenoidosus.AAC.4
MKVKKKRSACATLISSSLHQETASQACSPPKLMASSGANSEITCCSAPANQGLRPWGDPCTFQFNSSIPLCYGASWSEIQSSTRAVLSGAAIPLSRRAHSPPPS